MNTPDTPISPRQSRTARLTVVFTHSVCSLFGLLFVYAAASKLMEYDQFLLQMSKSPIITDYASLLVWMVPALEIVISIMLFVDRMRLMGLYAALALMCLFTAYIYAILNFSDTIPCSCGGVLEKLGWQEHLVFNIVFVMLAAVGIVLQTKIEENVRNGSGPGLSPPMD